MKFLKLFLFLTLISCSQSNFQYMKKNYSTNSVSYEKVELNDLFSDIDKYEGKNIEIKGYFIGNRNESAIYLKSQIKNGVWISFKDELFDNDGNPLLNSNIIYDLSNKNVIIKGKFDSKNKGNLALYKGSIIDVSYFGNK